ncbi:MAG: DUF4250 domain-containing protein [Lachnospira sp.]|nr:DUF4250 domain-containing protein [Clostridia bacterium]
MEMPKDPVMLLSFINTQLRDNYNSLTELCKTYSVDINQINKTLLAIDYVYDKSVNQFV